MAATFDIRASQDDPNADAALGLSELELSFSSAPPPAAGSQVEAFHQDQKLTEGPEPDGQAARSHRDALTPAQQAQSETSDAEDKAAEKQMSGDQQLGEAAAALSLTAAPSFLDSDQVRCLKHPTISAL